MLRSELCQIQQAVQNRVDETAAAHCDWPCRKGCDDCCRHLASVPQITRDEWEPIAAALSAMPQAVAESLHERILASADSVRPVVCPLLDTSAGACMIYEARPVACRTYGFYADRHQVLGCRRIEARAEGRPEIVWGNHAAIEDRLRALGAEAPIYEYLEA